MARPRLHRKRPFTLRLLHQYLGLGILFLTVILAITGILLNHSPALGLSSRNLSSDILLDLYGIDTRPPETGYPVFHSLVVHVEDRLFFGPDQELGTAVEGFAGALPLAIPGIAAAALQDGLLLFNEAGARVDFLPWPEQLKRVPSRLGRDNSGNLHVMFADRHFRLDDALTEWQPQSMPAPRDLVLAKPRRLDAGQGQAYRQAYRANVLNWERILLDLHSGRLAGQFGTWLADATGIGLLLLGLSGLLIWSRRFSRRRD